MIDARPDPDRLLNEAIDLTIRLQLDPANPVTIELIHAWRARSSEHERIWQRVSKAHGMSGAVLSKKRRSEQRRNQGLTRRNVIVGGVVGAAAVAAGAMLGPDIAIWRNADHQTRRGQIRRAALADGSNVTLGPDSAIALAFEGMPRRVQLLKGMAFFEVAHAPDRPFIVDAENITITALGTAFDITSDAGIISVGVQNGRVVARAPGINLPVAGHLDAGEWLSVDVSAREAEKGRREAEQVAAWRDNLLVAERETVAALVARISRWHEGRVVLVAPGIGDERVSGVFDLATPHRALEAVVHPAGGRVRHVSSLLTVITPL